MQGLGSLMGNLAAGFRLIACLPVRGEMFVARTDQLILLLVLAMAIQLGGAAIPAWPIAGVWAYGLGVMMLKFTAILACLQGFAWMLGDWRKAGGLQVMVLSGGVNAELAWLILANSIDWRVLPPYAGFLIPNSFLGFLAIATLRGLRMQFGLPWVWSALLGALLAVILLALGLKLGGVPLYQSG